jgi:UDP-glucuronate decarboxylase
MLDHTIRQRELINKMSMILVTGAGGFIGHHLCHLLVKQGYDVVGLDQHFVTPGPYPQLTGDICNADFLTEVLQAGTFDTIVHLAAVLNTASRLQPEAALRVNIGSSLALLQIAQRFKVRRFIFGSSISVYGPKPFVDYGEVSEEEPAAPNTVYGMSKRYVELVGQEYHRQEALQFVSVRIAMVVGAGATNTSTPWRSHIFEQLGTQKSARIDLPFDPTERLPLIHVEDVAEVIHQILLGEHPIYSIYNTPAENWIASDLAEYIRSLNTKIDVTYRPAFARGDPEAMNGQRFTDEFRYRQIPLRGRLRDYYLAKSMSEAHG